MNEQTTSDQIKFIHADDGVIDFWHGNTVFSDLFMIGAFSLTRKFKTSQVTCYSEYQTDLAGLKKIEAKSIDAVEQISESIVLLGSMFAQVREGEMNACDLSTYGWLISGLGELLGQLSRENRDINHSLRHLGHRD